MDTLAKQSIGHFVIDETVTLPTGITNGEYGLEIDIVYPKIQYLARVKDSIVLKVTGAVSAGGNELNYSDNGFCVLR